jgi:hypothetical protein
MALVFVIYYENDNQRDALYEILSTMDFAGVGDPVPAPPPDDPGEPGDPDDPGDSADD